MKTDKQFYKILQAVPKFFTDLIGIAFPKGYIFQAINLKDMEKHIDGMLLPQKIPKNEKYTAYIIEF